jgi:hypothetical protein
MTSLPSSKSAVTNEDGSAPWVDVEGAWKGADDVTTQAVADLFCDLFAWSQGVSVRAVDPKGVGSVKRVPVQLVGKKPTEVVGGFEDFYVGCPFISVA